MYFKMHNFAIVGRGALVILVMLTNGVNSDNSKIESDILFASPRDKHPLIVSFGSTDEMHFLTYRISETYYASRQETVYEMYKVLSNYSNECQNSAQSYLKTKGYTYHHNWVSNTIHVEDADQDCAEKLAKMQDVTSIAPDRVLPFIDPIDPVAAVGAGNSSAPKPPRVGMTWGLSKMYVGDAWKYGAYYGELKQGGGITAGTIDSGVRYTHEALKDNFRQYDGWADGYGISKNTPVDLNGHGTHTMGTIVGQYRIGVAPAAQWVACRGCLGRGCHHSALLFCCMWMICPFDTSKGHEAHSYRNCYPPDVLSNSWGGGRGDTTFDRCIAALHAAGIIPIWAIGNAGPKCSTANSPGDNKDVIGVSATNKDDEVAMFSSRGPTNDNRVKSDVGAPGVDVLSAWKTNDMSYISISGTSMATPHVAGLVVLMLERCTLPYKIILGILESTADREYLGITQQMCDGTRSDIFPNNFYGWGRVNALAAIKKVVETCHSDEYDNNYEGRLSYSFGNKLGGYIYRYASVPYYKSLYLNSELGY